MLCHYDCAASCSTRMFHRKWILFIDGIYLVNVVYCHQCVWSMRLACLFIFAHHIVCCRLHSSFLYLLIVSFFSFSSSSSSFFGLWKTSLTNKVKSIKRTKRNELMTRHESGQFRYVIFLFQICRARNRNENSIRMTLAKRTPSLN